MSHDPVRMADDSAVAESNRGLPDLEAVAAAARVVDGWITRRPRIRMCDCGACPGSTYKRDLTRLVRLASALARPSSAG
jgi:hypothetical protein